jgi:alkane 1-monooxygenase
MIVLAIVPAVWRQVMDPRVLSHFDGDLRQANLSPRKRDRILATYPPTTAADEVAGPPSRDRVDVPTADEVLAARCPACGYTYDVVTGDEREGFAAGTAWTDIPDGWCCPDCGVRDKVDFVPVDRQPAH